MDLGHIELTGLSARARGDRRPHECQGSVCKQSNFTKESQSRCFVSDFMDVSLSVIGVADHVHEKVVQLLPHQLTPQHYPVLRNRSVSG